jgi:PAS domain S-box-containing protein
MPRPNSASSILLGGPICYGASESGAVLAPCDGVPPEPPDGADHNLKQLRALGLCMSIDDFGTGYSSLASLKNLVVDELKIDRSFVQAMATDASARAIVRAIVDLADALKLRVVAEGVEDRATWDVLVGLGCDVAQGYLLSPPLAAAELQEWLVTEAPTWLDGVPSPGTRDPLQQRIRDRGARLTAEEEFVARKHAETALLASEERNRLSLQAAGIGTWERDAARDVLTWSTETERLHGLEPGAFDGTAAAMRRTIHPEDWPSFSEVMRASATDQRETLVTFRTVWPDGSVHWIESRARGLYQADGTLIRINGTSTDITERRLGEEALRASEERFRKQYKGLPLPTYSWLQVDEDFVLEDYNDAAEAVVGVGIRDWLGIQASVRYADEPAILTDLQACALDQRTLRREVHYQYPDTGRERDLAVTYVFVPPQTVMIHTEDVTEARQAEHQREALAQSEKLRALGQMATGIAHDLNQSLMLVASYSDLARHALVQNPPDFAELEDLLATTTQAALDGGETVKRLLLFTRAAPEHDSRPVDLGSVVREAARLTAPRWRDAAQAEGRPISLLVEADDHPLVQGSPSQLRELLTNMIFNAVDALPSGGSIRLRVVLQDGSGVVEVTDSGVGMTAEVQARVFEPFFTTKGEDGTGLGLAMVFGIVERHGGHIEVRSAPGAGTTFRIALPLTEAQPGKQSVASALVAVEPQLPLRVLVVDDEPMMTRAVARMLKPSGHVVSMAASGEDAVDQLAEHPFDVVLSDMGMGAGMNGWELADVVRRRWPDARFLLATGWGAAIDPVDALTRGVQGVLSKPYQLTDLLNALAESRPAA